MSSSTRNQTLDGYVTEYCNTHNISPLKAMQTAMVGLFIQEADNRDMAIYNEQKKGDKRCL